VVEVDRGEKVAVVGQGRGGRESGAGGRVRVGGRKGLWRHQRRKAGGRIPLSPFPKSHSSEADGRTAPFRSSPSLHPPGAWGGTRCTVPKKVQHPRGSIGEGADPCTGGERGGARDGR